MSLYAFTPLHLRGNIVIFISVQFAIHYNYWYLLLNSAYITIDVSVCLSGLMEEVGLINGGNERVDI